MYNLLASITHLRPRYQIASIAAEAGKAAGAQVRLLKVAKPRPPLWSKGKPPGKPKPMPWPIPTASAADMAWANAYLFLPPPALAAWPVKCGRLLIPWGVWAQGGLANKAVSAMTSAQNARRAGIDPSDLLLHRDALGQHHRCPRVYRPGPL